MEKRGGKACRPCDNARAKEYNARPEVRQRIKDWAKTPDVKQRKKEYFSKPETRERMRKFYSTPQQLEKKRQYFDCPEVKERISRYRAEYNTIPENADARKAYRKKYYEENAEESKLKSRSWYTLNKERAKERQKEYEAKLYQGFSSIYNGRLDANGVAAGSPNQLLVAKEYSKGSDWYAFPDYIQGLDYIQLDTDIIQYHSSSVKNGFSPSYIINFNTIPTEEEMVQAKKDLEKQYAGASNAGKIIMTFSDGKDRAPEMHKIETLDSDQRFIDLLALVSDGTFIAHQTPSALLSDKKAGQLGNVQEMRNAYAIWKEDYISSKQKMIERVLNKLAKYNGVVEKIEFVDYNVFAKLDAEAAKQESQTPLTQN